MTLGSAERQLAAWFGSGLTVWTVGFAAGYNQTLWVFLFVAVVAGARYGATKGKQFETA